jgi:hypothetical protein
MEIKRPNFYPNGEVIDYSLPQSFKKSLKKEACGNCGLYSNTEDHSVDVGVLNLLKILIFATNGEKDSFRDKTSNLDCCVIFMQHG